MAKKYRYEVSLCAEEDTIGTIDLTKKEAELVAWATDPANWNVRSSGNWCGYFSINLNNPMEIED